jgi:hypothetical protein
MPPSDSLKDLTNADGGQQPQVDVIHAPAASRQILDLFTNTKKSDEECDEFLRY